MRGRFYHGPQSNERKRSREHCVDLTSEGWTTLFKKYGYAWLTLGFIAVSLFLHWYFAWRSYIEEAAEHGQEPQQLEHLSQILRDTFENWQSEFLQLLWQVVGLAYFLYIGSPSSKENDDRLEAKVDALLILQGRKVSRSWRS
jgi:hypothetical protein